MISRKLLFILFLFIIYSVKIFADNPIIIESQPNSIVECAGTSIQIKVVASGGVNQLIYEWQKSSASDGTYTAVPGGVADIYSFASVSTGDNGFYRCVINDGVSLQVITDTIEMTIHPGVPNILGISSVNSELCEGKSNVFSANLENPQYIYIEWFHNNLRLPQYGTSYTVYNATNNNSGDYFFIASNACGRDTSDTLNLQIIHNPRITAHIVNQTVCEASDVTLTASASGDNLEYYWLKDGVVIANENTNSLIIQDIIRPHSFFYQMVVFNQCTSDTTLRASIVVNNYPQITANPFNEQVCLGETVVFNTNSDGTTERTYQWYNESGIVANETGTSIEVNTSGDFVNGYYCLITNTCGTVSTDTAEIILKQVLEVSQQPVGGTYCAGDNVVLQTKVVGHTPVYFQWLKDDVNVNGANVVGANEEILRINGIVISQAGLYYCHASNECGIINTDTVEIIINEPIQLTQDISSIEVCEGLSFSLSPQIYGTTPIQHSWYILGNTESIGNGATYTISSSTSANSGEYYCIMTNVCGNISTDTVNILVKTLPQVTIQPTAQDVCLGDDVQFVVEATGYAPLMYTWYRNASVVSGQTTNILHYLSAQQNQSGNYHCQVLNECGSVQSQTVGLAVGTIPSIILQPRPKTICELDTIKLIMSAQGDSFYYQWYFNNNPIIGQTDSALNIYPAQMLNQGNYFCKIYNSCTGISGIDTETVQVTINPAPVVNLGEDLNKCQGESVVLSTEGDFASYNWNNGLTTTPTYTAQLGGTFILEVMARETNCKNRDTIVVTFHPKFNVNIGNNEMTICGNSKVLNVEEGAYSYLWSNGEATSSITVTQSGTYSVTATGSSFGCESTDEVILTLLTPVEFSLGDDISASVDSYVNIGVEPIYTSYYWNTSYTGPSLFVDGSTYGIGSHMFWLKVTAENGCYDFDTINITFYQGNSVDMIDFNNQIAIYPNPSNSVVNLTYENGIINDILVYNAIGDQIFNKKMKSDNFTLDVTTFASGIYYVKIISDKNEVCIRKLIKQ